ncbi:MAG: hemolysin family protein [Verrucomicrobiales bacterium]|nr:hemolysin family protein [Verrucomicrobiales bacterium]
MGPEALNLAGIIGKLMAVIALVLLNGFFVAAEFALVKVRATQLDPMASRGSRRARVARQVIGHLDAYLSATQLGITIASLALGWIGEPIFAVLLDPLMGWLRVESPEVRHSIAVAVGFSIITFLHIVAGELAPKSIAIQKPVATALWVAEPLLWFYKLSYPFIWLLNNTSLWMLRRIGLEPVSEGELVHSEEELRLLISASPEREGEAALGRNIVLNALDLRRRTARQVMRPRQEITALNTEWTIAECLDVAEKTRYSRFPLCEAGDLDKTLGVVHFKDLFAMRLKVRRGADLLPAARKLIYVPATARLEKLLQLFLERKSHLAIVVDEYGGTVGLVTLENILEEVVGQIQDEFDQEKPLLQKVGEQTWVVDGAWPLHELSELVGENLQAEDVTTTSGWITHQLGGFPKVGDVLPVGQFELRVEAMDGLRVARLRATRISKPIEPPPPEGIRE